MDLVLEHRFSKESCGRDEGRGKRTFEAFKGSNVSKLFCSKSSEDGRGTGRQVLRASLAVVTYSEKNPLVRELFYILFRAEPTSVALIKSEAPLLCRTSQPIQFSRSLR